MFSKIKIFLKKHDTNFFIKFMYNLYKKFKFRIAQTFAERRLKHVAKLASMKSMDRQICVVFLVIDPNTWNKFSLIYSTMVADVRFKVRMVCLPPPYYEDRNVTYNYFKTHGYDCVDARLGGEIKQNGWYDIKGLNPDYVFYCEPYNSYFYRDYKSYVVAKYAKICATGYGGMTILEEFLDVRPDDFYRDVYLYYATNRDEAEYNYSKFRDAHLKKLQYTKYLGTPAFAADLKAKGSKSTSWAFSRNKFKVVWTPRWTTDEKLGGSNFFKYKNFMFSLVKENKNIDFLFRPHPMAFDNFIKTGQMSREAVDEFYQICDKTSNLSLDISKEYASTFWESNVLITDISSVIVEYFITGKPIIFCPTEKRQCHFLSYFKDILSACYIANTAGEITKYLLDLYNGNDPLKVRRSKLIEDLFCGDFSITPKLIVDDIANDFVESCNKNNS